VRGLGERVGVITGAAGGLGLALARVLQADGMRLIVSDSDGAALARAGDRLDGSRTVTHVADVRDPAAVDGLAVVARDAFGRVDLVVNNAGIWTLGYQWETSLGDWHRVVDVNLFGTINGVRAFVPLLLANPDGGHVVNVASMGGLVGSAFAGPYGASKHAVVGLSKGLRAELASLGAPVGVTVACPGRIRTGFVEQADEGATTTRPADVQAVLDAMRAHEDTAMDPHDAAVVIRDALVEGRFWAFPNAAAHRPMVEHETAEVLDALDGSGR
jgi:NAD(P)-dependent dehydrogenase (short-subunit alcohol dehydrogenase family)